jgi:peptide/nickel transport system permease protein
VLYFVARRLFSALTVVVATLIVTFALFFIAPSDPAAAICGERQCTQERYEDIQRSLKLDQPKVEQFAGYVSGLFVGRQFEAGGSVRECPAPCLGFSYKFDQPVLEILKQRLPVTVSLALGGAVVFLIVGVTVGSMAAKRRGTTGDRALVTTTLVMSSIPYYLVALMVALYLTIFYNILPRGQWTPLTENPGKWFFGLITPWLVLGIYNSTSYSRFSRGSMVETLSEDYIRTARAKGLSDKRVTYKHALRSALIPVVTIFGLDLAALLSGTIFTEAIFDMPGIGKIALDSLRTFDLPVIMGVVMIGSVVLVTMNFLVDIGYSLLDPRVRLV